MNTIINIYYFEYTSSRKLWTKENKRQRKTKRFSLPFITVRIPPTIAQSIIVMPRNLLNPDEIIRIPSFKLMAIIRGNKPLLLQKMIYTEHPLAKKLQDVSVLTYIPEWNNNIEITKIIPKNKEKENITEDKKARKKQEYEEITFDNF